MNVNINNINYNFYDDGKSWKRQNVADYLVPAPVGPHLCFIKKFEQVTDGISFLKKIKGKEVRSIPQVYDVQTNLKDGTEFLYAFQEFLSGDTLDNCLYNNTTIDVKTLVKDLSSGLAEFHRHNYWHTDFCLKNIFLSTKKRLYLIDIDSCLNGYISPTVDNIVNHDLSAPIFSRLKEINSAFEFEQLNGINLNILQLVILIILLKRYAVSKTANFNDIFYDVDNNKLIETFPELDNLLLESLTKSLSTDDIFTVYDQLFSDDNCLINLGGKKGISTQENPFIALPPLKGSTQPTIEFIVNGKNIRFIKAKLNETLDLNWMINNADKSRFKLIDLETGKIIDLNLSFPKGKKEFEVRKNQKIIIEASSGTESEGDVLHTTKELIIEVDIPIVKEPEILSFGINDKEEKFVTLPKGKPILLTWKVKNAVKVKLNDQYIYTKKSKSLIYKVKGDQKLTLVAINKIGENTKESKPKVLEIRERKEGSIGKIKHVSAVIEKETDSVKNTVEIVPPPNPQITSFTMNGQAVDFLKLEKNSAIHLAWTTQHTDHVMLNGVRQAANHSIHEVLESQKIYELIAGHDKRTIAAIIKLQEPEIVSTEIAKALPNKELRKNIRHDRYNSQRMKIWWLILLISTITIVIAANYFL